mmetsp:Transcript_18573/g.27681  ORF Transcript_18573/g.27681 Transcript_18573/m.27681 type:complete len:331 (+) Transcript_18573:53-1045(+)
MSNNTKIEQDNTTSIQINSLVLTKIIKHAADNLPDLVSGKLLGFDLDENILEVSDCFPTPELDDDLTNKEYEAEMLRNLQDVNVDHNLVGWYQTTYMGSFLSSDVIEQQFSLQVNRPDCICIVYDPVKSSQGALSIKAYRLSKAFMTLRRESNTFTATALASSGIKDILEELDVHVHNPLLIQAMLAEMATSAAFNPAPTLDIPQTSFLEKNVEFLIDLSSDLITDHYKTHTVERKRLQQQAMQKKWMAQRKAENAQRRKRGQRQLPSRGNPDKDHLWKPIAEPNKLPTLIISKQMEQYCEGIKEFSGTSFGKLLLLDGLQTSTVDQSEK